MLFWLQDYLTQGPLLGAVTPRHKHQRVVPFLTPRCLILPRRAKLRSLAPSSSERGPESLELGTKAALTDVDGRTTAGSPSHSEHTMEEDVEAHWTKGWAPWPTGLHAAEEEKKRKEEEERKKEGKGGEGQECITAARSSRGGSSHLEPAAATGVGSAAAIAATGAIGAIIATTTRAANATAVAPATIAATVTGVGVANLQP